MPASLGFRMNPTKSDGETFREKVCRQFDVPLERYAEVVLNYTLYGHAQWLRHFAANGYLEPDRAFITAVGRLTRTRGFAGAVWDFQHDARNRSFSRHRLRLRVSVRRMRELFSEVWGEPIPANADETRSRSVRNAGSFLAE